jgi:hypothetical protein
MMSQSASVDVNLNVKGFKVSTVDDVSIVTGCGHGDPGDDLLP